MPDWGGGLAGAGSGAALGTMIAPGLGTAIGGGIGGLMGLFGGGDNSQENQAHFVNSELANILRDIRRSGLGYLSPEKLEPLYNKYFGQAFSNLYGQQQRQVGSAGATGLAQAASMGLSNPYALVNRYQNQAYQFGNLALGQTEAMTKIPQLAYGAEQDLYRNILAYLQAQGGLFGQPKQAPGFGESVGSFLGQGLSGALAVGGGKWLGNRLSPETIKSN